MAIRGNKRRRLAVGGGIAVAVFCLLLALLCVMLTLPPGENILKGIVESRLSDALTVQVTIEQLETNLLSRVVLSDMRLSDTSTTASGSY